VVVRRQCRSARPPARRKRAGNRLLDRRTLLGPWHRHRIGACGDRLCLFGNRCRADPRGRPRGQSGLAPRARKVRLSVVWRWPLPGQGTERLGAGGPVPAGAAHLGLAARLGLHRPSPYPRALTRALDIRPAPPEGDAACSGCLWWVAVPAAARGIRGRQVALPLPARAGASALAPAPPATLHRCTTLRGRDLQRDERDRAIRSARIAAWAPAPRFLPVSAHRGQGTCYSRGQAAPPRPPLSRGRE